MIANYLYRSFKIISVLNLRLSYFNYTLFFFLAVYDSSQRWREHAGKIIFGFVDSMLHEIF